MELVHKWVPNWKLYMFQFRLCLPVLVLPLNVYLNETISQKKGRITYKQREYFFLLIKKESFANYG